MQNSCVFKVGQVGLIIPPLTPTPTPIPIPTHVSVCVAPSSSIHHPSTMHRRQPPRRYACTRCVQLKVKCVPTDTGQCQRCIRLGHPTCVFPKDVRGNNASNSPQTPIPSIPSQGRDDEFIFHEQITPQIAEELLERYRKHKMPQFPFVIIPPTTDLATLRQESPFLLLCILTACLEHNLPLQDSLELIVRKEIASRVIVGIERNMDLLQGLLVHIAWQHYHWRTYHTHMYMLLPIATMIVVDLGLDTDDNFRMQPIPAEDRELEQASGNGQVQSAAEQRALLGCYYQCSKYVTALYSLASANVSLGRRSSAVNCTCGIRSGLSTALNLWRESLSIQRTRTSKYTLMLGPYPGKATFFLMRNMGQIVLKAGNESSSVSLTSKWKQKLSARLLLQKMTVWSLPTLRNDQAKYSRVSTPRARWITRPCPRPRPPANERRVQPPRRESTKRPHKIGPYYHRHVSDYPPIRRSLPSILCIWHHLVLFAHPRETKLALSSC
jgi:hypothetical protein